MLTVDKIDTRNKAQVRRFVSIPYRLYAKCKQWVPPLLMDVNTQLDREKHPFFEHSDADFFIVSRDGRDVGRIAAIENKPFNKCHGTHKANFYLFECEDDQEAANALFARVFEWAKARGLDILVGPKGFSPFDGYGMLVEGYEYRQMMMMMNYNYAYYNTLVQNLGFEKEVDFVSCYINRTIFKMPERVHSIAKRVEERGELKVVKFKNKKEMINNWAPKIARLYNATFINNWEYYPLTDREIDFAVKNVLVIADHRLIKLIMHGEDIVGFVFAFPDISAALQRARGHLFPFGLVDMLLEFKRTKWLSGNGAGILPEFQGRGGNALLYTELEKTLVDFQFTEAELTQVAETAVQMRHDLVNLGGKPYKNHRVYRKQI
jgi:hypothetical protein